MKVNEDSTLDDNAEITGILKEDFPDLYEILKDVEIETNVCGEEFKKKLFAAAAAKMEENRKLDEQEGRKKANSDD